MNMSYHGCKLIKEPNQRYEKKYSMRDEIFERASKVHNQIRGPNSILLSSNENCSSVQLKNPNSDSFGVSVMSNSISRKKKSKRKQYDNQVEFEDHPYSSKLMK